MPNRDELLQLRRESSSDLQRMQAQVDSTRMSEFENRCREVLEKLDMRLRAAAMQHYLELKLIEVDWHQLVDLSLISTYDSSRRSTLGGGSDWRTVRPYQDRSVLRHPLLEELWDRLVAKGLRPIFIEGAYGAPILGVQLPDGGPYPRIDDAATVASRTLNRMDYFLTETGGIAFTAPQPLARAGEA